VVGVDTVNGCFLCDRWTFFNPPRWKDQIDTAGFLHQSRIMDYRPNIDKKTDQPDHQDMEQRADRMQTIGGAEVKREPSKDRSAPSFFRPAALYAAGGCPYMVSLNQKRGWRGSIAPSASWQIS
jgi:hypothetical protein